MSRLVIYNRRMYNIICNIRKNNRDNKTHLEYEAFCNKNDNVLCMKRTKKLIIMTFDRMEHS